ncbi:hypothetical protein E2C01_060896 [Portunus trituberculatus]|uniref:Uncharacterized protein n=1 Tax=Portunus trituberculatus TaxID=210409 RepID=A0A5B7HAV9_PORTR|nr:hypothetical protein [Portunus trituberculatus]
MRIETVGGNRERATVGCFGEEEKMRFSKGEVVFYRLKIRSKTANVAEVNEEKVEGGVKTFQIVTERAVQPGDISGLPEGNSEAGFGVPILNFGFYVKSKVLCDSREHPSNPMLNTLNLTTALSPSPDTKVYIPCLKPSSYF